MLHKRELIGKEDTSSLSLAAESRVDAASSDCKGGQAALPIVTFDEMCLVARW